MQEDKEITIKELVDLWISNNKIKHKGGTISKYQFLIDRHIVPDIGNICISKVSSIFINTYLKDKLECGRLDSNGGLSPSYVRSISIIISSALKFATEEGIYTGIRSTIFKPIVPKKSPNYLDSERIKQLESIALKEIEPTTVGILLSLQAGMRIGEVCALSWDDVDLFSKIIHVRHTISRINNSDSCEQKTKLIVDTPKTNSSIRDIPISSVLFPVLLKAKKQSCSDFVVSDSKGFINPRTFEYRYHKFLDKYGIEKINYHALRHSFATRCVEVGVDIKSLSEMLGHANVSITLETYVHSSMKQKRAQIEKITTFSA